jgi:hypothetical protein
VRFNDFVSWAFYALITGAIVLSASSLQTLTSGVTELNIKLAVIVERTETLTREVSEHNERIVQLEQLRKTGRNK